VEVLVLVDSRYYKNEHTEIMTHVSSTQSQSLLPKVKALQGMCFVSPEHWMVVMGLNSSSAELINIFIGCANGLVM
jgi:hypothetical protein